MQAASRHVLKQLPIGLRKIYVWSDAVRIDRKYIADALGGSYLATEVAFMCEWKLELFLAERVTVSLLFCQRFPCLLAFV